MALSGAADAIEVYDTMDCPGTAPARYQYRLARRHLSDYTLVITLTSTLFDALAPVRSGAVMEENKRVSYSVGRVLGGARE